MKRELKKFIKGKEKFVNFVYEKEGSSLYTWSKFRNPFRVIYNFLIVKFCSYIFLNLKVFLFRYFLGMRIGKKVGVAPGVNFDYFFPELIKIDDHVTIGLNVNILCHEFTNNNIRFGRVVLGKNSVIGAFSTIRSGVSIGENSVVAMNSFVNKDVPSNEIWGGVPAKFISKIKKTKFF